MIKMSFFDGTMNRAELKDFIAKTDKPVLFTYGFAYRNPTTCKKPVTREEALSIVDKYGLLDADEYEGYLHLNAFSSNDMW